ncbi:zinc ribbon domain-containing protein [Alkaliphilus sp. MSJ-5]|uniref:Zinc ribbon domain-containing protein n=1 Tax=Alkaliphilus flagellatus TaxID=2841507 RepID=A0ABS6G3P1_9FIRM|nr:zinc ribbon domain-containing protein [Alkaliphilus flagellatus]MBU5677097.1 zinc ribbon domain-containing protein [Alkaliphilus flagellatus]
MSLLEKLSNTLSETAKSLGKKSSEFVEISKLSLNAQKKQDKIQDKYEQIGKYVYSKLKRVSYITREELEPWINEINALEGDIDRLEKMALNIRNIKHCTYCNIELDDDANYCPLCGKYLN